MKRSFLLLAAVSVLGLSSANGAPHQFTSADGSKTLDATLISYDATKGTIQLRISGGRAITAPLNAFSEKDIEYVKQSSQRLAIARSLMVDIRTSADKEVETKTNTAKVEKQNSGFSLNFRNNGFVPLDGVTAKYRIFYHQDQDKGGKLDKTQDGTIQLSSLGPRESEMVKTEKVELTTVKPSIVCVGGT